MTNSNFTTNTQRNTQSNTESNTNTARNQRTAHDIYFRTAMQNRPIALAFFKQHLPSKLCNALDLSALKLENTSFVDTQLQETISDLVFSCRYLTDSAANRKGKSTAKSKNHGKGRPKKRLKATEENKIYLLVEHQSTPQRLLPFRVHHYLFNLLYTEQKGRKKTKANHKLPAVYAMVFYNGKRTPYPYSLNLADCFYDPLGIMVDFFAHGVPLIDVNQIDDDELMRHQLAGMMAAAMKHIHDKESKAYFVTYIQFLIDLNDPLAVDLAKSTMRYILGTDQTTLEQFLKSCQALPNQMRGEYMTLAEQFRQLGVKQGRQEGRQEGLAEGIQKGLEKAAINLLKSNKDPKFIGDVTGLDLAVVLGLKAKLEQA